MKDYFEFSVDVKNLLFHGWNSSNAGMLVGMCCAIAVVVLTLEGITLLQSYMHKCVRAHVPARCTPRPTETSTMPAPEQPALLNPLIDTVVVRQQYRQRVKYHVLQTVLRVVQLVMAYLVMLAIMSYNAWILVTVTIAYGVGYYFLGAVRNVIAMSNVEAPPESVPSSTPDTDRTSVRGDAL